MPVANGRATRRDFMAALGAGGLSVLGKVGVSSASVQGSAANAPTNTRRRIDVHHHILPPEYVRFPVVIGVANRRSTSVLRKSVLFWPWTMPAKLQYWRSTNAPECKSPFNRKRA